MPWSEIFRFFYLLGFVNAFFFGILVISKKEKRQADSILAIWLMILALQFLWPFIYLANFNKYYILAGYEVLIFCLHPIFLFNYIKALTQQQTSRKNIILGIATFAIITISMVPFFLLDNEIRKDIIIKNQKIPFEILPAFFFIIFSIIYYLSAGFVALKKHKNKTLHLFSYHDNVDLLWLRRLIIAYTTISILSIPVIVILETKGLSLALSDYIFYSTLVIFVFFLGYWGYQQGSIFNLNDYSNTNNELKNNKPITDDSILADGQTLTRIMNQQKPYLDPTLSLHQLADISTYTPHHLSKVINKAFNKNFFEYINAYRIEEFKLRLLNPNNKGFTLLGIALECGFNSKSAFNRIFKEHTGLTPGEYKNSIINN